MVNARSILADLSAPVDPDTQAWLVLINALTMRDDLGLRAATQTKKKLRAVPDILSRADKSV